MQQKYSGPLPLSASLSKVMKKIYDKKLSAINKILINWHLIVEKEIFERTKPKKITTRKKGDERIKTLILEVSDSSAAIEIEHMKGEIIEMISTFFGFAPIEEIKVIQKPLHSKKDKA